MYKANRHRQSYKGNDKIQHNLNKFVLNLNIVSKLPTRQVKPAGIFLRSLKADSLCVFL